MIEDVVKVTPAVDLQVVFSADGGRAFQVRMAPLPLDTSASELNESLDRLLMAVDRQIARYELMDSESRLKEQVNRIEKYEGLVITLEEKAKIEWEQKNRKGEWSSENLPPAVRNARETTMVNLQKERAEADALQDKIFRLRSTVNGHVDGRANSQSG